MKGKKIYVPPKVLEVVQLEMNRKKIKRARALEEMAQDAKIGAEIKRMMRLDWTK